MAPLNGPWIKGAAFLVVLVTVSVLVGVALWRFEPERRGGQAIAQTSGSPQPPNVPNVPNVVGIAAARAKGDINSLGFDPKVAHGWSKQRKGSVIRQHPAAGTKAEPGTSVTYVISDGLPVVPRWVWKGIDGPVPTYGNAATQELAKLDLRVGDIVPVVSIKFWDLPGQVIASTPRSGRSVPPGTTVKLYVVKPPGCTPGYSACLPPHSGAYSWKDYDCTGGPGDGPYYAPFTRVTGDDPYGLDDDGDGFGCERSPRLHRDSLW